MDTIPRSVFALATAMCLACPLAAAQSTTSQSMQSRGDSQQSDSNDWQQAGKLGHRNTGTNTSTGTQADAGASMSDQALTGDDFARIDTDHDGRISAAEAANAGLGSRFKALDMDGDGYISSAEFHAGMRADKPTPP